MNLLDNDEKEGVEADKMTDKKRKFNDLVSTFQGMTGS